MRHKKPPQPLFSPDDELGNPWAEVASRTDASRDAFIAVYSRPIVALQDNRCPICLGNVYTCDCGKVAGRNLAKNTLTSTDEGDE